MGEFMGRHDHCAYNQTRECFLALEIGELNFHTAKPADLSISFAFNSGEGLWLTPFKEIPLTEMDVPVDLVFLDEGDSVIEVVESSSTFGRLQVDPRIASLLLVPRHTIYSSQTQAADQLIICMAGEMASRLERISELTSAGMVQRAALLNLAPSEDGAPEEEPSPVGSRIAAAGSTESTQVDFAVNKEEVVFNPPGNWLTRWWTPDPRKVRRLPVDNLVAGARAAPQTRDSFEVLIRGFLEARDLLTTFRFDNKGTRDKFGYWFEGKLGNSWKADHSKCEQFFKKLGHPGSQFAAR
jgi:hypothetical protein